VGYWYTGDMNPNHNLTVSSLNGHWNAMTHMVVGALVPASNGTVSWIYDANYATNVPAIVNAAHSNGLKVMVDLFDANQQLNTAVGSNLSTLIANVMDQVSRFGFDGVEIDWEQNINYTNLTSLLSALRTAIGPNAPMIMGADINQFKYYGQTGAQYLSKVAPGLYDMGSCVAGGTWFDQALHNTASGIGNATSYWSYDLVRTRMLGAGVPASKLMMGMSWLGKVYTGGSPGISGPYQSCSSGYNSQEINYNSLINKYNLSNLRIDSVTGEPWMPVSGGWMDIENATSIANKVAYNKQYNLGGWFMFNLFADYMPNQSVQHPLLAAVQGATGTAAASYSAPSIDSPSVLSAGTVGTPYSLDISASGTPPMTWAVTSGAIPSGLSLNSSDGMVSGTPSTASSSSFTVAVSNAAGTSSKQFSLTINPLATASWFTLISKNSGKCLDVSNMSTSSGALLQQYNCWGGDGQKFQFTPVQGGYKITAKNSGLQLDVEGGATQDGTPIVQHPYSGGKNQIWNLKPNVDGSYSIVVLSSSKCASVAGSSMSDGAPVQEWTCNGGADQKWQMTPTE
jgi:Glycosyl hydrolases family 18/Ricin-type beta-trefoil lectin domain/Putative Ig domain